LGDHSCAEEGDLGYAKDNDSSSWVVHSGHLLDFGEGLSSARGITVLMRQRKMAEAKVTPLPAAAPLSSCIEHHLGPETCSGCDSGVEGGPTRVRPTGANAIGSLA
jgi:hypothetical protein